MTISPKIWEFPSFPISKQIFRVPGSALQGGLTSGSAQIMTPEPGGYGMLEIEPSLQINEWQTPMGSWLMSKSNGQILRVRLAPTPQVSYSRRRGASAVDWDTGLLWSNQHEWEGDMSAVWGSAALAGSSSAVINLTGIGRVLDLGHVVGNGNNCHLIDEIEYSGTTDFCNVTLNPPLRKDVATNDPCYLRPWFVGRIANPQEVIATYDADQNGLIQLGKIILNEAVI